jgi:DNA-binding transcriptional MerR regulator
MNVLAKFSRQKTIELTGATSNNLSYWSRTGLIVPTRVKSTHATRPECFYTLTQLIEISALLRFSSKLSSSNMKSIIDALRNAGHQLKLLRQYVLLINQEVRFVGTRDEAVRIIAEFAIKQSEDESTSFQLLAPIGDDIFYESLAAHLEDVSQK